MTRRGTVAVALAVLGLGGQAAAAVRVKTSRAIGPPELAAFPSAIEFTTVKGATASVTLTIRNAGGETLRWSVKTAPRWAFFDPRRGELEHDAKQDVEVVIDTKGLDDGRNEGEIVIEPEGASAAPMKIRIALDIVPPVAPPSSREGEEPSPWQKLRGGERESYEIWVAVGTAGHDASYEPELTFTVPRQTRRGRFETSLRLSTRWTEGNDYWYDGVFDNWTYYDFEQTWLELSVALRKDAPSRREWLGAYLTAGGSLFVVVTSDFYGDHYYDDGITWGTDWYDYEDGLSLRFGAHLRAVAYARPFWAEMRFRLGPDFSDSVPLGFPRNVNSSVTGMEWLVGAGWRW